MGSNVQKIKIVKESKEVKESIQKIAMTISLSMAMLHCGQCIIWLTPKHNSNT